jgi:peptidyl-prolyl cis-trans isomerase B (cyclophilin B)
MQSNRALPVLILILALVAALIPVAIGADRPEDSLTLTAARDSAILGETVELTVKLSRRMGKPREVNMLRLARNSITFEVSVQERKHLVTRIYGDLVRDGLDQWVIRDKSPPRATLKRGKPLEYQLPFHAMLTGKITVKAVYRGFDATGPEELASDPVTIEVTPPPGHQELTADLVTSEGTMTLALLPNRAFNTVFNFLSLVRDSRYAGLTFHRIIPNFLIQGGDPKGNGLGGPGWTIPGEFDPELKHIKGTVSMARAAPLDSAGSQFFIMLGTDQSLDGDHAVFARVVEGLSVLDRLAKVELKPRGDGKPSSVPLEPPVIQAVRLGTR